MRALLVGLISMFCIGPSALADNNWPETPSTATPQEKASEAGARSWAHRIELTIDLGAELFRSESLSPFDNGVILTGGFMMRVPYWRSLGVILWAQPVGGSSLSTGAYYRLQGPEWATTFHIAATTLSPLSGATVNQPSSISGATFRIDFNKLSKNDYGEDEVKGFGFSPYAAVFPGVSQRNGVSFGVLFNYTFHMIPLPKKE